MQIDRRKFLDDLEKSVRLVEFFYFLFEFEFLENFANLGRKALDVGSEIR
jgi:hypothetical protein